MDTIGRTGSSALAVLRRNSQTNECCSWTGFESNKEIWQAAVSRLWYYHKEIEKQKKGNFPFRFMVQSVRSVYIYV